MQHEFKFRTQVMYYVRFEGKCTHSCQLAKNVNQIEEALLDRLYKVVKHNSAPVRNSASFLHKFIIT